MKHRYDSGLRKIPTLRHAAGAEKYRKDKVRLTQAQKKAKKEKQVARKRDREQRREALVRTGAEQVEGSHAMIDESEIPSSSMLEEKDDKEEREEGRSKDQKRQKLGLELSDE